MKSYIVALILVGIASAFYFRNAQTHYQKPVHQTTTDAKYPVRENRGSSPSTANDVNLVDALIGLVGKDLFASRFNIANLVDKIVATVDSAGGPEQISPERSLFKSPDSDFLVTAENDNFVLSPDNFQRYGPYVRLARNVDAQNLVALYRHLYPKFQTAYQSLGSQTYFNDRLVEVVDKLLQTPEVNGPIKLVQPTPHSRYKFADEELENLTAGQKAIIRMGPDNARIIKGKLRRIRKLLVESL